MRMGITSPSSHPLQHNLPTLSSATTMYGADRYQKEFKLKTHTKGYMILLRDALLLHSSTPLMRLSQSAATSAPLAIRTDAT